MIHTHTHTRDTIVHYYWTYSLLKIEISFIQIIIYQLNIVRIPVLVLLQEIYLPTSITFHLFISN